MSSVKDLALAFVIGSSVMSTFVTMFYVGHAFARSGCPCDVGLQWLGLIVPVLYGLANIVLVKYGNGLMVAVLAGAGLGLVLSLIGRFALGLPRKIFGFSVANEWRVHFIAAALYIGIFVFIVRNINAYFGL